MLLIMSVFWLTRQYMRKLTSQKSNIFPLNTPSIEKLLFMFNYSQLCSKLCSEQNQYGNSPSWLGPTRIGGDGRIHPFQYRRSFLYHSRFASCLPELGRGRLNKNKQKKSKMRRTLKLDGRMKIKIGGVNSSKN